MHGETLYVDRFAWKTHSLDGDSLQQIGSFERQSLFIVFSQRPTEQRLILYDFVVVGQAISKAQLKIEITLWLFNIAMENHSF